MNIPSQLTRRGFDLGEIPEQTTTPTMPSVKTIQTAWENNQAIDLPALIKPQLTDYQAHIAKAHQYMVNILQGDAWEALLEKHTHSRLAPEFSCVAASIEEHDEQGIEKVYFDVEKDDAILAEDLWCKASWLSFHDEDASLRFRFSFGMEGYEDVAADPERQYWAGELCERIFPESSIITQNNTILDILSHILGKKPDFVERIVYFNAPNGGAQFHHDVERGHAGVVFAQLSGATFWLALDKQTLMDEIILFAHSNPVSHALQSLIQHRQALSDAMEEPDHEAVENLIDQNRHFIQYLIQKGYSHRLEAGDVLLLPQRDLDSCVWHSVFTLGDMPGEALSFAVR